MVDISPGMPHGTTQSTSFKANAQYSVYRRYKYIIVLTYSVYGTQQQVGTYTTLHSQALDLRDRVRGITSSRGILDDFRDGILADTHTL